MDYSYINHTFGPGQTVNAVIYKYNGHNMDSALLTSLHKVFFELNPTANPPKLGQTVLIPIINETENS